MIAIQNIAQFGEALRRVFPLFIRKCFTELNGGTAYEHSWHIEALAHELERCRQGQNTRLIATQPPRSLKSLVTSIAWPAFILGHDPSKRIVVVSYSDYLASKLGRDFRQVVTSGWYRRIFPGMIASKVSETEFETSRGGGRLAVSIGGSITGRGGNFIIIDDPIKPDEASSKSTRDGVNDCYPSTLYSRLDNKITGVIVLVMQRLHPEDLAGYLLKQGGWRHLNLPAIATRDERFDLGGGRFYDRKVGDLLQPAREPQHVLDQIKRTLGSHRFLAQYQQEPVPETGSRISRDWLRYYSVLPPRSESTIVTQSYDTAMKGDQIHDYAVCTTWLVDKGHHYLVDLVRRQCTYPALSQLVLDQYRLHRPGALLIEDKGSGTSLIQDLLHRYQISALPILPVGDKVVRMERAALIFEQGLVHFPKDAPWLAELENELLLFPDAPNDDQVDSISQYLLWHLARTRKCTFEYEFIG